MPAIELLWLIATAAGIGFVHTLAGPDHYAPLATMAIARKWSASKTFWLTLICGSGHLVGSILLGALGIWLGYKVSGLELIESTRGEMAAWVLLCLGIAYLAWGLRRAKRATSHSHWHAHEGYFHCHPHNHFKSHAHIHDEFSPAATGDSENTLTLSGFAFAPWVMLLSSFWVLVKH